jgi:hypothetical protein
MGILAGEKFKPALFVGLGGNGGKIVNQLAERLARHPQWDRIAPLTHFIAIDTNKNDLDSQRAIRPDCRFLISNFDARAYVERKQGKHELEEDRGFTQWWPAEYAPRPGMSPGAGQIRIESRLKLYYNLEEDRMGLRRRVFALFDQMTGRENPWRDNEDRSLRVYIYGSVAGGTGSGGFLPMAYLLRQWVEDHGWGRPNVVGMLSLPTTFLTKVRPELHKDIAANGYAALKELEYLSRTLGYAGGLDELEFHYDPGTLDSRRLFARGRPFSLCYLIDRPEQLAIEKYEHAVADASYLQIFSPLLGAQAGEYDNYEKHQRSLAQGHFAVNYGAFGTALLHFPRRDVLRYASMRFTARALGDWLTFGGDDPEFRVPYGDPAFQRLAEEERVRRIDDAFERYVVSRATAEARADELGVFTQVNDLKGKGGVHLPTKLRESFAEIYARLEELIVLAPVDQMSVNPGNPSIHRPIANLREDMSKSREAVRLYLESQLTELRTGRFFERFFDAWQVNPIAQRLLLIRTLKSPFLTPAVPSDADGGESDLDYAFLNEPGAPVDFDGEYVRTEVERRNADLQSSANQGFFQKLRDRDNATFQAAKRKSIQLVEQLEADCRDELKRGFWKRFESELRSISETVLQAFRKVAEISDEEARRATAEAERFRRDPGSFPDSEIAQHYLDAEVMRDDRRRERLWNLLFTHLLDRDAYFDAKRLFTVVTEAFQPARDPDGRLRAREATEIVRLVRDTLSTQATEVYGRAMEELGLDLARGLDLEQRYIHLLDTGADLNALRAEGRLDDVIRAVPATVVRKGVEDRLVRTSQECVVLAHLDATRRDDPTVVPASVFYAGLHQRFDSDEAGSLGALLRAAVPGVNLVPDWAERDSLVLYKAMLGVPVYWFKNVGAVLEPAYRRVVADERRSYPLHIEGSWERDPGIPNLDPIEIKAAETRRKAEEAARAASVQRRARVRAFTLCTLFGQLVRKDGGWHWVLSGSTGALGTTRLQAYDALQQLDPTLRSLLEQNAEEAFGQQAGDLRTRAALTETVSAHLAGLTSAYAAAVASLDEAEKHFLGEERAVVEGLLTRNPLPPPRG